MQALLHPRIRSAFELARAGEPKALATLKALVDEGRWDLFVCQREQEAFFQIPPGTRFPTTLALLGNAAAREVIHTFPGSPLAYVRLDKITFQESSDQNVEHILHKLGQGMETLVWGRLVDGEFLLKGGYDYVRAAQDRGDTHLLARLLPVQHHLVDPDVGPEDTNPTLTVQEDGSLVPWLAARGPLAYSPRNPPAQGEEWLFDYTQFMSEAFEDGFLFQNRPARFGGGDFGGMTNCVNTFWKEVQAGRVREVYYSEGKVTKDGFQAPMAVYAFKLLGVSYYMLLQNGSYQWVKASQHPEIEEGFVMVERGIGHADKYIHRELFSDQAVEDSSLRIFYSLFLRMTFSLSLNAFVYGSAEKCNAETAHIGRNSLSSVFFNYVKKNGYPEALHSLIFWLSHRCSNQSFTLNDWSSRQKFGPHYVALQTPLSNIRLTPHFTGEYEVTVLDPNRVTFIGSHGCRIYRAYPQLRGFSDQEIQDLQQAGIDVSRFLK